nr:hypothetical protein HmN_000911800 [Hymenolepis microstoma]
MPINGINSTAAPDDHEVSSTPTVIERIRARETPWFGHVNVAFSATLFFSQAKEEEDRIRVQRYYSIKD